jgi:hypothetical protein
MIAWNAEFSQRRREIERYFKFLEEQEAKPETDQELLKTLKATGFLLLYNIVEASIKSAITAIMDELRSNKVSFDDVNLGLRKIALARLRARSDEKLLNTDSVAVELLTASFDSEARFTGNLDAKKIRETAEDYGFSSATDRTLTRDGVDLLTIKTTRNDLGHGSKSFAEVGREYGVASLVEISERVLIYLESILRNVGDYLGSKQYLKAATAKAP